MMQNGRITHPSGLQWSLKGMNNILKTSNCSKNYLLLDQMRKDMCSTRALSDIRTESGWGTIQKHKKQLCCLYTLVALGDILGSKELIKELKLFLPGQL